jgi:DNA (cytosine-5)-methyltransferase 1
MGYHLAGFEVVGVDLYPQPNYPFAFIQADALSMTSSGDVDLIHASPPCQAFTVYGNNKKHVKQDHPNLIPPTREMLKAFGVPYVIENVPGAPLHDPVRLCGTSFPPLEVRRHRIFESSFPIPPKPCNHSRLTERKYPGSTNRPNGRTVCNIGEYRVPLAIQKKAIGIDWMTLPELSQAIPPAYTEYIGNAFLNARVAA